MATIVGKTSDEIDRLIDALVSSASLEPNGQLLLTKGDGSVVGVGSVASSVVGASVNATGQLVLKTRDGNEVVVSKVSTLDSTWPVGSIYFSDLAANPSAKLGGGTWTLWGSGKMPIAVDTTDPNLASANLTGGSKQISEAQLPPHTHDPGTLSAVANGAHTHTVHRRTSTGATAGMAQGGGTASADGDSTTTENGNHSHSISGKTAATGSGDDYLPPYITCYMWKRTA